LVKKKVLVSFAGEESTAPNVGHWSIRVTEGVLDHFRGLFNRSHWSSLGQEKSCLIPRNAEKLSLLVSESVLFTRDITASIGVVCYWKTRQSLHSWLKIAQMVKLFFVVEEHFSTSPPFRQKKKKKIGAPLKALCTLFLYT
jgi:hypothetical protein